MFRTIKKGFRITNKLNKYRSEIISQAKTDNLSYLVNPTFSEANRLIAL